MRRIILIILGIVLVAFAAHATTPTPTVNPLLPAINTPLNAQVVQQQFSHVYNDEVYIYSLIANSGGVFWPTSGDIVISNSTSTPAGLAPVNGDCVIASGGAWGAAACPGGIGTSSPGQLLWNSSGSVAGLTMSGDCTIVASTGVISCSNLNASNLTSGTVPPARLPLGSTTTAGAFIAGSGLAVSSTGVLSATATGGGSSALGSATTANPYINGDFTSGFYTAAPSEVDVEASGTQAMSWTSTAVTVPSLNSAALVGTTSSGLMGNVQVGSGLTLTTTLLTATGAQPPFASTTTAGIIQLLDGGGLTATSTGVTSVNSLGLITTGIHDTNYGNPTVGQGSPLYRTQGGQVGGLTTGNPNNTVQEKFEAGVMLGSISQNAFVDPATFGAQCDTLYFDGRNGTGMGTVTASNATLSISGYTWSASDVGKVVAINNGGYTSLGVPAGTIVSVNTGANTAQMSVTPTVSTTSAYVVLGHDDTTAIHNATVFVSALHGSKLLARDGCGIRELTLASGSMIDGGQISVGYPFIDIKPTWYVLGTSFSDDSTHYGINTTSAFRWGLSGFEIKGSAFPFLNGAGGSASPVLSLIGSKIGIANGGGAAQTTNLALSHMTLQDGWVLLGYALNEAGQSGGMVGIQGDHDQYSNATYAFNGSFNDSQFESEVWTNGFGEAIHCTGCSLRIIGGRIEETPNSNNGYSPGSIDLNGGIIVISSLEWQFNSTYNLYLSGNYAVTVTGGAMEGGGVALATGHRAQIGLNGSGATNALHLSNVTFDNHNFSAGGQSQYIFDGITTGANNSNVEILGGDVCRIPGYTTAIANFAIGSAQQPTVYRIGTTDCPQTFIGRSDYSLINGALGLNTSSPTAGVGLDMLADTTTANSSLGLPNGSVANRPTTPKAGMLRLNTDTPNVEAYYGGQWNSFLANTTSSIINVAPGQGISSSLIAGGNTAIVKSGTLYADASYFYGSKGGLTLSNDTGTPNTIIDIAPGSAADDSGNVMMKLGSPYTKTTGSWALGSGNGCLDTGAVGNNKWYHVFLMERGDTGVSDLLCSTSASSPIFPSNYDFKRDLGAFETDGSAHIVGFKQIGNNFYRTGGRALDYTTTTLGTSAVLVTLPDVPTGASVVPIGTLSLSNSTTSCVLVSSSVESDEAPDCTYPVTAEPGADALYVSTSGVVNYQLPIVNTNSSQQIRLRSSQANTSAGIVIRGYTYNFAPSNYVANFLFGTLPSGFTFTRGSTATYYNSVGLLATAGVNSPRFDYNPSTLSLNGILVEGARTNLTGSDPGSGGWTADQLGLTIAHNTIATLSPDGTNDASSWNDGIGTSVHRSFNVATTTTGSNYTFSGYVKASTASAIQFDFASNQYANFDIANGLISITTGSSITSSIQPINNGWYRVSISGVAASGQATPQIALINSTTSSGFNPSYTGTNQAAYLYGLQWELGSFPTSYVSSGTRSADALSLSPIPLFNTGSGTFTVSGMIEGKHTSRTTYMTTLSDTTTSNNLFLSLSTTGQAQGGDTVSGSGTISAGSAGAPSVGVVFNQTLNYASANNSVLFNGSADGAGTFGGASIPSGISTLQLGDLSDGSKTCDCWIQTFSYSP